MEPNGNKQAKNICPNCHILRPLRVVYWKRRGRGFFSAPKERVRYIMGKRILALAVICLLFTALPAGPAGAGGIEYDLAYVREMKDYSIYYLFDMDTHTLRQFRTNEAVALVGSFTGDPEGGMDIRFRQDWHEGLRAVSPGDRSRAVLTDFSGFTFEYVLTDVSRAAALLTGGGYTELRLE